MFFRKKKKDTQEDEFRWIDDGFGSWWKLCEKEDCGLQVVRPGKVQCNCEYSLNEYEPSNIGRWMVVDD